MAESYRKRWRIETGYRVKKKVRGKTCSRSYAVRLFLQLLSMVLYNLWQLYNSMARMIGERKEHGILEEFKDLIVDCILREDIFIVTQAC